MSDSGSHRMQLQRALGDLGEVLPRVPRGGGVHPAAGWYADIGGELIFLGDHTGVAFVAVHELVMAGAAAE